MSLTKLMDDQDDNIAIHIKSNEAFPGDVMLTFVVGSEQKPISIVLLAEQVGLFCQTILDNHMRYLPKSEQEIQ